MPFIFLGLNLEAEFLVDDDDDVDEVEAVDAHVVLELGIVLDFVLVNFELVNEEFANLLFYFLS